MSNEKKKGLSIPQITRIGLSAAIICILGPLSVPIPVSEVPVSLSILGIFLALVILGLKEGTISILIYMLLGLVGLPVFAGFTGGFGKLFGPTGGYIIGYIPLALIAGFFIWKFNWKIVPMVIGMILGTASCYLLGTIWLGKLANLSFSAALAAGVIPYIPFDLAKMVIGIAVGLPIHKALVKAGLFE